MFIRVIFVGLLLVSGMGIVHAADDAYLKMLEGEAETVELDKSGQLDRQSTQKSVQKKKKKTSEFGWSGMIDGDNLPKGLQREEFELVLEENFYGTFMFFKKLNSADKQTVYYRYTKADSKDLENVRKNILELLKR